MLAILRYKMLLFAIVTLSALTGYGVACAPSGFKSKTLLETSESSISFRDSLNSCSFSDPSTLSNVIKQKFDISSGDIPIVDSKGVTKKDISCGDGKTAVDCFYIKKYRPDLGESDLNKGLLGNSACSPTKFRITTELFINACQLALKTPAVKDRLFPLGVDNYDYLYLTFTGRHPELVEVSVLKSLQSNFEDETKKAVAACAAVAGSLESLTIM
ncbi:MAG: hypothetical protein IPJ71_03945 [Bdellovibrionales bacterium]|nr:hypothetical protein [Bdellovibrionales bacterium]